MRFSSWVSLDYSLLLEVTLALSSTLAEAFISGLLSKSGLVYEV